MRKAGLRLEQMMNTGKGFAVDWLRRVAIAILTEHGAIMSKCPTNKELTRLFRIYTGITLRWKRMNDIREQAINLRRGLPETANVGIMPVQIDKANFYTSKAWQMTRYEALRINDGRCELCGASKAEGARLHVDHIKPRSLYPHLALVVSNLQVLCAACNQGKSNVDDTDWRR